MNTLIFCFKILFYLLKLCHQVAKSTFSTVIILKKQLLPFMYLDFPVAVYLSLEQANNLH